MFSDTNWGGAILLQNGSAAVVEDSELTANSANDGGAIFVHWQANLTLSDSLISDFSAGPPTLSESTLSDGAATPGVQGSLEPRAAALPLTQLLLASAMHHIPTCADEQIY